MKANELRIGNWVKFTNRSALRSTGFARVEAVSIKEGIMYTRDADTWWLTPEWIEPIPLDPEILEKCGFVKEYEFMTHINMDANGIPADDVGHKTFVIDGFDCRLRLVDRIDSGVYYVYAEYDENKVHVAEPQYYLHQLQNLYFALTGEELNVEL